MQLKSGRAMVDFSGMAILPDSADLLAKMASNFENVKPTLSASLKNTLTISWPCCVLMIAMHVLHVRSVRVRSVELFMEHILLQLIRIE